MDNMQERLASCFLALFPDLNRDQISTASSETVESWDSVAGVTLLAVVEEEFGISIDADDLSQFVSFRGFLSYLEGAKNGSQNAGTKTAALSSGTGPAEVKPTLPA